MPEGSSDLIRAARSYFRVKGAALDVVPVVVIDNNALGPVVPYRAWYAGSISSKVAAQYAYVWITNEDGVQGQIAPTGPGKSAVVIDEIYVRTYDLIDDYFISISRKGSITPGASAKGNDAAQAPEADLVTNPLFGNISVNQTTQAGQLWGNNSQLWPGGPLGTVTRIPGPFVLPPQGICAVNPATVNNGILAMFRGRYYPAI